jgi:hypothetical protein
MEIDTIQFCEDLFEGNFSLFLVKRPDDVMAQFYDLAGADQVGYNGRTHAAWGKAHNGIYFRDHGYNFLIGDDNASAYGREAKLGKAHTENRILIPNGFGAGKNNPGEGGAVGIIDNQRDIIYTGNLT